MDNSVSILTVTYGNREKYVKRLVEAAQVLPNVKRIIIVWNGNRPLEQDFFMKNLIHNVYMDTNTGSATAYSKGIETFLTKYQSLDYLWMLDDDNLPKTHSLESLLEDYRTDDGSSVYNAFRIDRTELKQRGYQRYEPNSFFEFSIASKIRNKFFDLKKAKTKDKRFITCETVPYGGLLLPVGLVRTIGLPKKEMYLYSDDNEYTYRLTKQGLIIKTDTEAHIVDMEESWYRKTSKPMFETVFHTDKLFNAVYTIRNRVFFEKNNIMHQKFGYLSNIIIYLIYVAVFYMPKNKSGIKRFKMIVRLISMGWRGELGVIPLATIKNWGELGA